MKIVVLLWLCLLTNVAHASQAGALPAAVARATVQLGVKMSLGGGGVVMDNFVAYLRTHAPDVYASYADEQSLQTQIHKLLVAEKDITAKTLANQKKYFRGEMYDLKELVKATINNTSITTRMAQQHGGVTMAEIIATFKTRYPNIYRIYTDNKQENEHGLRSVMGRVMSQTMPDKFFIAEIPTNSPFPLRKYFWGKEPDLSATLTSLFSLPALLSRMQWQARGISMDELVTRIKQAQPDVYDYYVQATQEKEEWWLRQQLYRVLAETVEPLLAAKITTEKDTTTSTEGIPASLWLTQARVFSLTAVNQQGANITKVFYGIPSDLNIKVASKFGQQRLQQRSKDSPEFTSLQVLLRDSLLSKQVDFFPVLHEVVSSLAPAMHLAAAGVSMDDAVAKVKEMAPDVYDLYRRASYNSSEEGLRVDLANALTKVYTDTEPITLEPTFTLTLPDDTPTKQTTKYFLHATAQLSTLLPELLSKLDISRATAAGIAKVILGDYYDYPTSAVSHVFRDVLNLPPQPLELNDSQDTDFLRHLAQLYDNIAANHEQAFQLLQQAVATALERSVKEGKLNVINPTISQDRKYAVAD